MDKVLAIAIQIVIVLSVIIPMVFYYNINGLNERVCILDKKSTLAWKGVCCIIVVQFHTPVSNVLYHALGFCSAFIVTTLFSLIAAYGMSLSFIYKNNYLRRIPIRIFRISFAYILIRIINYLIVGKSAIIGIRWINTIILFYIVFYLVHYFCKNFHYADFILCIFWIAYCVWAYYCKNKYFAWPGESLGYAYGIILARYKTEIEVIITRYGKKISVIATFSSCLLAGLYSWQAYDRGNYAGYMYVVRLLLTISVIIMFLVITAYVPLHNRLLELCGSMCLYVFLIHSLIIEVSKNYMQDGWLLLCCIGGSLFVSFGWYWVELKLNPKIKKIFFNLRILGKN